jgi:predicted signal transduction protein with EAL and GGDEF domain
MQVAADEPEAAFALAARIVAVVESRPFMVNGQPIHLAASVGVALCPGDGEDPADLMQKADLALYAAKAEGRATFCRYDVSLDEKMRARRAIEAGLRTAIAEGQLELHYQPLVDAATGCITSAEALVRWNHPERGLIPPVEFIGIAEETGLILPLGEWVLRTACAEAATWPANMGVAINLSPVQFREKSLVDIIAAALESAGLAADRLDLEITEGVLLSDEQGTMQTLNELVALGVRVSMDDFGTGYSSLSYLRKFPFDKIKIDQSFVSQLPEDDESAAIVRAIITMAKCLGMATTVEGVETQAQFAFSVDAGCDTLQGYLISRPLPSAALASFVEVGADPSLGRVAA